MTSHWYAVPSFTVAGGPIQHRELGVLGRALPIVDPRDLGRPEDHRLEAQLGMPQRDRPPRPLRDRRVARLFASSSRLAGFHAELR